MGGGGAGQTNVSFSTWPPNVQDLWRGEVGGARRPSIKQQNKKSPASGKSEGHKREYPAR